MVHAIAHPKITTQCHHQPPCTTKHPPPTTTDHSSSTSRTNTHPPPRQPPNTDRLNEPPHSTPIHPRLKQLQPDSIQSHLVPCSSAPKYTRSNSSPDCARAPKAPVWALASAPALAPVWAAPEPVHCKRQKTRKEAIRSEAQKTTAHTWLSWYMGSAMYRQDYFKNKNEQQSIIFLIRFFKF